MTTLLNLIMTTLLNLITTTLLNLIMTTLFDLIMTTLLNLMTTLQPSCHYLENLQGLRKNFSHITFLFGS